MKYIDYRYLILVNRNNMLPFGYIPKDLCYPDVYVDRFDEKKFLRHRAALELKRLFDGAKERGYELVAVSGFRSYERQRQIYESSVLTRGQEYTDRYIARPGCSEHQTGLAMDISVAELNYELVEEFADTMQGRWLQYNAHKYGFIIRYPKNKESITGYNYEPWHIRYVGRKAARYMYWRNITLEEFLSIR